MSRHRDCSYDMALQMGLVGLRGVPIVLVLLGLAAVACSDDQISTRPSPSSTAPSITAPTSTPEPTVLGPVGCPVSEWVCDAAMLVQSSLQSADFALLLQRAEFATFECPIERPSGLGGPYPLCDDTPGETRTGFATYNDVTRLVETPERLRSFYLATMIDAETAGGDWRVRSVACATDSVPDGCERALIVFGFVDAQDEILGPSISVFELQQRPDGWVFTSLANIFALPDGVIETLVDGGPTLSGTPHTAIADFGPFHRWSVK